MIDSCRPCKELLHESAAARVAGDGVMDRHATVSWMRRRVDVHASSLPTGAYVAVTVHDATNRARDQVVEYIITDNTRLDDAVGAGIEIARALIGGIRLD